MMKFSQTNNHLCLYKTILKNENPVLLLYIHCFTYSLLCIKMKNHLKCAECVHHDHSCVDISWESLNHTQNQLKSDLSAVKKSLTQALVKVTRLCKTLKCMKNKIFKKVLYLACELTDNNDDVFDDESSSDFFHFDSLSPDFLKSIIFLPQTAAASLCSSWDLLLVFKLTLRYHILFTWQDSELFH